MRKQPSRWSVTVAILAAIALSGCGSGTDSSEPMSSGGGTPAPSQPAKPETAPETMEPAQEGPASTEPVEQAAFITLATTTSFDNTGLAQVLADKFREETGIAVKIIAQGTGAALKTGEQGDADVLVVHAPTDEQALVDSGHAIERVTFMHNTFMVVGPEADPAKVAEAADAEDAFRRIAEAGATFVSRGDNSGTHKKERAIWTAIEQNPTPDSATWYVESGTGMGKTLLIANEKNAYTLSDIGTYLAYKAEGRIESISLCDQGDTLYNPYSVMLVNAEKFPAGQIKVDEARQFAAFLQREDIQKLIGEYKRDEFNQSLFVPDLLPDTEGQ
jgi:tungstate transport system substrate-binding protein